MHRVETKLKDIQQLIYSSLLRQGFYFRFVYIKIWFLYLHWPQKSTIHLTITLTTSGSGSIYLYTLFHFSLNIWNCSISLAVWIQFLPAVQGFDTFQLTLAVRGLLLLILPSELSSCVSLHSYSMLTSVCVRRWFVMTRHLHRSPCITTFPLPPTSLPSTSPPTPWPSATSTGLSSSSLCMSGTVCVCGMTSDWLHTSFTTTQVDSINTLYYWWCFHWRRKRIPVELHQQMV